MACRLLDPRSAAYMLADFSQHFEKSDVNENCKMFPFKKNIWKRHLQNYLIYFQI